VRERPEFFIRQMRVYFEREPISEFRLTPAVSPNPVIRCPLKLTRAGTLRVVFVNNDGRQWDVAEAIEPAGEAKGDVMGRKAQRKLERREQGGPPARSSGRGRRRMWIVGTLLALVAIVAGVGTWVLDGARATAEPAPTFNLPASTGHVITLDDFLGKQQVVLLFYMVAT